MRLTKGNALAGFGTGERASCDHLEGKPRSSASPARSAATPRLTARSAHEVRKRVPLPRGQTDEPSQSKAQHRERARLRHARTATRTAGPATGQRHVCNCRLVADVTRWARRICDGEVRRPSDEAGAVGFSLCVTWLAHTCTEACASCGTPHS